VTFRDSLQVPNNDSIFGLLETGDSKTSLNVVPIRYANVSKYFLGINNSNIENYQKINVQSVLFSYKGRNRILYYTLRNVQKGEELYIDYNGGLADLYPTDDFK
jgi:SET domain-containing protein